MSYLWWGVISRRVRRAYLTLALSLCTLVSQAVLINPATADGVVHNQLSVVSWGSGRLDVFVAREIPNSTSSRVWVKSFQNTWTDWSSIAVVPADSSISIDAVSWGIGRIDLFIVGDSIESGKRDSVWHKYQDTGNGVPGWQPSGSGEYLGGSTEGVFNNGKGIQAVSWGPNRLDIFPITLGLPSNSVSFLHKSWNGSSWAPSRTGWNTVYKKNSDLVITRHHVVSEAQGRMDIFRVPSDSRQIEHKRYQSGGWSSGWTHVNGGLALAGSVPYAVSPQLNVLDVFVRGTDEAVWMDHYGTGGTHNAWHWMGSGDNVNGGSPSAVTAHWSTVNVFENTKDANGNGSVYRKRINISTGSPAGTGDPWMDLGSGDFWHAPEAVSWGTNRIDLFGYGVDGNLYHKWSNDDGNTWGPSQTGWELIPMPPFI